MTDTSDGSPGSGQAALAAQLPRCRCPLGGCVYPVVADLNRHAKETGVCFSCRRNIHFGHYPQEDS